MQMQNRSYVNSGADYKYGFNGMEMDNELNGVALSYSTKYRQYDPRLGKWFSVDPLSFVKPWESDYVSMGKNPINHIDPNGDKDDKPNASNPNDPLKKKTPSTVTIEGGVMSGDQVINSITNTTLRPKMKAINAVVLHRTVSSSASSAIRTTMQHKGSTGFHIVVDKDGTITQVNNLENRANHVGKTKGTVSNFNSIGIEVVGMPIDKDGNTTLVSSEIVGWEPLTSEQIENTAQAVSAILQEYDLSFDDIFNHEDVSWKTAGEGKTVNDAIKNRVGELMQDYIQKKAYEEEIKTHKDSVRKDKSVTN